MISTSLSDGLVGVYERERERERAGHYVEHLRLILLGFLTVVGATLSSGQSQHRISSPRVRRAVWVAESYCLKYTYSQELTDGVGFAQECVSGCKSDRSTKPSA